MFIKPKQDYITNKCMCIWMYNLPHLPCYTSAPMASMHEYVNACSWHQSKKWRQTLIFSMWRKRTIKQWNRDSYLWKIAKIETYLCKGIRNRIKKSSIRVSGQNHAYTWISLHMHNSTRMHMQNYVYAGSTTGTLVKNTTTQKTEQSFKTTNLTT